MAIPWEIFSSIISLSKRGDIVKKSIYVIKNKINNKVYVGQAIDPQHRFIAHLSRAKTNADNSPIHDAIEALGKENFYYKILQ